MLITDDVTLNEIKNTVTGYLYNYFGTQFSGTATTFNTRDNNKLHRSFCPQVNKVIFITGNKFTKHFFESKQDAMNWLELNRSVQEFTLCKLCKP